MPVLFDIDAEQIPLFTLAQMVDDIFFKEKIKVIGSLIQEIIGGLFVHHIFIL